VADGGTQHVGVALVVVLLLGEAAEGARDVGATEGFSAMIRALLIGGFPDAKAAAAAFSLFSG